MNRSLLERYNSDVEFPDVSGAEVLHMLVVRDALEEQSAALTQAQRRTLRAADEALLRNAPAFWEALAPLVDLERERQQRATPRQRWWWFLDVLAHAPYTSPASVAA
jgi:hypothetical protein